MKFIATVYPELLESLGPKEACESKLKAVFENIFWATTLPINREQNIKVELVSHCHVDIRLDLNQRDAEIVKDMLYEALQRHFEPEYETDINVEINTEL